MIRLSEEVLPENRKDVNGYIADVWEQVMIYVRSFKWRKSTEDLKAKFKSHIAAEEARLQKNLEDIKYDIDSYDVVRLISGNGRVETVWLLLASGLDPTHSPTDSFPYVISCPQERLAEDQPCSQARFR